MLGGTANEKAYDLYLSARGLLKAVNRGGRDLEIISECLDQIELAIKKDDKFALAWALKSNAHDSAQVYFPLDVVKHRKNAEIAAKRAFELEPKLPQVHLELAFKSVANLKWNEAEAHFDEARKLGLSGDELGEYAYLLVSTGHIRRARDMFLELQSKDPLNSTLFMYLTVTYDILGDTPAALGFYKRGKLLFSSWVAGDFNAVVTKWGRGDKRGGERIAGTIPGPVFQSLKGLYGKPAALTKIRQLEGVHADPISRMSIAALAAHLGDQDLALTALIDACEAVPLYAHKFWQPLFTKVRKLQGFKDFVTKRGFVDYWQTHGWPDQCKKVGSGFKFV